MSAWETSEAICQHVMIRLRADRRIDQCPSNADVLSSTTNHMRSYVLQVRLAELHEMRPWLGKDVLQTLRDEETKSDGKCKAREANMKLPYLPPNGLRAGQ